MASTQRWVAKTVIPEIDFGGTFFRSIFPFLDILKEELSQFLIMPAFPVHHMTGWCEGYFTTSTELTVSVCLFLSVLTYHGVQIELLVLAHIWFISALLKWMKNEELDPGCACDCWVVWHQLQGEGQTGHKRIITYAVKAIDACLRAWAACLCVWLILMR